MIASLCAFASAASAIAGTAALLGSRPPAAHGGLARRIAAAVPARLRPPLDLAARIEAAGSPGGLGAGEVMAVKALCAFAATPVATALAAAAPGRLGVLVIAATPTAAFFAPDLHLRRLTRERVRSARRDLPALLDLVRVAVDAGMAPSQALAAVGSRSDSRLGREFAAAAAQTQLGVPLADALAALNRRLPAPELQALTAAIQRAVLHGAPLSDTLAAQARDARQTRRRRIEEEAAKAAPKIQLVVALLLVPSVLLMVAAALAAALLGAHGPLPGR